MTDNGQTHETDRGRLEAASNSLARIADIDVGLERRAQRIAERYAPACVVTDENFRILHVSGRIARYIEPTAGAATRDLLNLVHRGLRLALRTALNRAREINEATHAGQISLALNGREVLVDIAVEPIQDGPQGHRNFVVLFKDEPIRTAHRSDNNSAVLVRSDHIERLESELRVTRERLLATNEELETSREELQSVNEELTTVNGELAHRVRELTRATGDLKRAEERQRLLLAELQHRVRNTLGVMRSIARRSAETSLTVADYASHLDGRLNAFARTQMLVTRDPGSGVDLEYLVAEELTAYNARDGEQLSIAGPAIRLQPKAAETFALALHELATNALKYGALSKPSGRIDIAWRIARHQGSDDLIFEWREQGGPQVAPPRRKGFGTEMLERTLAFEFKARTSLGFEAQGMHCTIIIPLTRHIVHTPAMDG